MSLQNSKLVQTTVTALKPDALVPTGRKRKSFWIEAEKRTEEWEENFGLRLREQDEVTIDLTADQIPLVQAAVDAGDISATGFTSKKGAKG